MTFGLTEAFLQDEEEPSRNVPDSDEDLNLLVDAPMTDERFRSLMRKRHKPSTDADVNDPYMHAGARPDDPEAGENELFAAYMSNFPGFRNVRASAHS